MALVEGIHQVAIVMKIVLYTAGLGNQIFQYFFCQYLKEKYPGEKIYGCYDKAILNNHNGLEVQNVFGIELPPTNKLVYVLERLIRAFYKRTHCSWFSSHDEATKDTLYYEGYWHNKLLFEDYVPALRFREPAETSEQNQTVLNQIRNCHSVSIHIRRGDYLNPEFEARFAHSCTPDYYRQAIDYALGMWPDAEFFVFSDDIEWVRSNMQIPRAHYIDWNKGKDSHWDMRLMSECHASIIANSSFSFWGAMLGHSKQFVVRPKKWIGDEVPEIFPQDWMII